MTIKTTNHEWIHRTIVPLDKRVVMSQEKDAAVDMAILQVSYMLDIVYKSDLKSTL